MRVLATLRILSAAMMPCMALAARRTQTGTQSGTHGGTQPGARPTSGLVADSTIAQVIANYNRQHLHENVALVPVSAEPAVMQAIAGVAKRHGTPVGPPKRGMTTFSFAERAPSAGDVANDMSADGFPPRFADAEAEAIVAMINRSKTKQFAVFTVGNATGAAEVERTGSGLSATVRYSLICGWIVALVGLAVRLARPRVIRSTEREGPLRAEETEY